MEAIFQTVSKMYPLSNVPVHRTELRRIRGLIESAGINVSDSEIKAFQNEKLREVEIRYNQGLETILLEEKEHNSHLSCKDWERLVGTILQMWEHHLAQQQEKVYTRIKIISWAADLVVHTTLRHGTETECSLVSDDDECMICIVAVKGEWGHFQCGHHACMSCINQWLDEKENCLYCRTTVSELHVYSRG